MLEINWRTGRQKLANFKVIFDLFISCFYFIQQQRTLVLLQLKIQSTPQILITTPYWPYECP